MGALILAAALLLVGSGQDEAPPTRDAVPEDGSAWERARQDGDRSERAQAVVAALDEAAGDPEALHPRQLRAFEVFQLEHDDFQGARSVALAEAMHRHAAATWSAFCLEGALRRTGDYGRADAVLREHLGRDLGPAERVDVVLRRAIVAAGAGDRAGELAALGRGLVGGGADAYQMLGRLALVEGRAAEARGLFRVLVDRHATDPAGAPPWALRGWGLALLPPPAEPLRR